MAPWGCLAFQKAKVPDVFHSAMNLRNWQRVCLDRPTRDCLQVSSQVIQLRHSEHLCVYSTARLALAHFKHECIGGLGGYCIESECGDIRPPATFEAIPL